MGVGPRAPRPATGNHSNACILTLPPTPLSSAEWRRGSGRGGAPQEPLASTDQKPLSPAPLPALRCGERESTTVVVARCARCRAAHGKCPARLSMAEQASESKYGHLKTKSE